MEETVAVTAVEPVGADTVAVEFAVPEGFEARPGQFLRITADVADEEVSRFYTLSSPTVADRAEITVAVDPEEGGSFSERLAGLSAGDELRIAGPFGEQYYEGEPRAVVLAGGPGVGPAVAIAERAIREGNEAAVVYRADAPAHEERLDALRESGATVTLLAADAALDAAVAEAITGADGERAFVYGFAEFVDAATEAVAAAGGDSDGAKVENFG